MDLTKYLRSIHAVYGLPSSGGGHRQTALWLFTRQMALSPHCSGIHGSLHFCPIHARCSGHSGSDTHSGFGAVKSAILYYTNINVTMTRGGWAVFFNANGW